MFECGQAADEEAVREELQGVKTFSGSR